MPPLGGKPAAAACLEDFGMSGPTRAQTALWLRSREKLPLGRRGQLF
ncbi:hypothetical protein DB30_02851 [Enhygromyxa salina]|uniref:Uncharacterized protein n=1 Tax=Enhygromyxa salina TaxID=215803 RepID=A0A0C2A361_9BACT|nr:hypothetical protein DB30_02851 [Enhygromyxa salina]